MADWTRGRDPTEQRAGERHATPARDLEPAIRDRAGLYGGPRLRPFSAPDVAALQMLAGNRAVARLLSVQRDGPDEAWTTGGEPPATEGGGWSTGGPAPVGEGPVEEPGYGPPDAEPEEPGADENVELARWVSYAGLAIPTKGRWFVMASRPRSGPGIIPGSTAGVSIRGGPGDFGLPDTTLFRVSGYRATVAVWSTAGPAEFVNPSSKLIRITIGEPLIRSAGGPGPPVPERPELGPKGQLLLQGSTGQAVADLQNQLGIEADGVFGPGTGAAVRRFQASHGLDVDGIVGPKTHAALDAEPVIPATGGA